MVDVMDLRKKLTKGKHLLCLKANLIQQILIKRELKHDLVAR